MTLKERLLERTAIKIKHGGQSALVDHSPCTEQDEQEEPVALGPPYRGEEYGYNHSVLVCFSVAVIISPYIFRSEGSQEELKAGSMEGAAD